MILRYIGAFLFFLMLVAPFEFYEIKIFIIGVLIIHRLFLILKSGMTGISKSVFFWFLILILFGLFFSFWSLLFPFSNIGFVFKILPVYVVWPIVYMLFIPYMLNNQIAVMLNRTMVYASLFISGYLILAFLSLIGLMPISFEIFTLAKPILGRSESIEAQLFMPAVTSLLFLNPFLLTSLLLGLHKRYGISQIMVFFTFLLTTLAIIVTGRRSLMLNILIAPLIIYFLFAFSHVKLMAKEKKVIVKLLIFLLIIGFTLFSYISYFGLVDFGIFWDFFISGFDFSLDGNDAGSALRGEQFYLMLQSWIDYPILGAGLASSSEYIIRNSEAPWMYELSYLALLFQTGIVGFIIYISLLFWLFFKAVLIVRKNKKASYIIPIFVGCFCFLVACASNPYLAAFDHMWTLFLPAGWINYCNFKEIEIHRD